MFSKLKAVSLIRPKRAPMKFGMFSLCAVIVSARPVCPTSGLLKSRQTISTKSAFISKYCCNRLETGGIPKAYFSTLKSAVGDDEVKESTDKWIRNVVIGLNMCPFAEKIRSKKKLFTTVVRGDDVEEILGTILYESILRHEDEGTTVIVCPELSPDSFIDFYDVVGMAEEMLHDQDMEGIIQIAPFHPLFEFAGSGHDGLDNLTNRSPYPIFHILREEEVSAAVEKLDGDSSKVWQRNISLLECMEEKYGRDLTEKIMIGEKAKGLKELLRNIRSDTEDRESF